MALRLDFKQVEVEFAQCKTSDELKAEMLRYKKLMDDDQITVKQYWAVQNLNARAIDRLSFNNRHLKHFDKVGNNGFKIKA